MGSYNGHKMTKIAPNGLNFEPDIYSYEFYKIPEVFGEFSKLSDCDFKKKKNWMKIVSGP